MNKMLKQIELNNKEIIELKNTIQKYYNRNIDSINIYEVSDNQANLEDILKKQSDDIATLNIIVDTEAQKIDNIRRKKLEELKLKESDTVFSNLYRNGFICVNNIDVSVDKFYMKEIEMDGKILYNFICTDLRVDKKLFNTIDDRDYEVKKVYRLKDNIIFYQMYLDKELFIDNKIDLNTEERLTKFMKYIHNWTIDKHKMVAETMID